MGLIWLPALAIKKWSSIATRLSYNHWHPHEWEPITIRSIDGGPLAENCEAIASHEHNSTNYTNRLKS